MFSTLEFILAVHIVFFFQSQKLEDKRIDQLTTNHWLASLLRYILFFHDFNRDANNGSLKMIKLS